MTYPHWSLPEVLAGRPAIRINQVGYLPGTTMQATLVSDARQRLDVELTDADGAVRWSGRSSPWSEAPEPTSGLTVHVIDFSGAEVRGNGLRLSASGGLHSHPFGIDHVPYREISLDALRLFRLLRSGQEVTDTVLAGQGRPAGHIGEHPNTGDRSVPAWQGPEAEQLYPGWRCPGRFDVSGGWYDAGDYGKYVTSGSIAVWQLLSTLDVLPTVPGSADFARQLRAECGWQLDWLLRMQVPSGRPLAGLAFHRVHGTKWSPLPGWAHEDPTTRVLHRPSTSASFQLAAAAANGAWRFRRVDPAFARRLVGAARRAYAAAVDHPVLVAPDDHARFGGGPYPDADPEDDSYWAAVELWLATGEQTYLDDVRASALHESGDVFPEDGFDGDRVAAAARLDLALHGAGVPEQERMREDVCRAADRLIDVRQRQPWGQPYAPPDGWAWGSNGRILNNLVVLVVAQLLTAAEGSRAAGRYRDAVAGGIDYLFGRNALGQCYLTGYGIDDTRHQRTRQFGQALDARLPPVPPGALAGGANSRPSPDFPYDDRLRGLPPQCCYLDEPTSEVTNDICIRWNAPLVYVSGFLAGLVPLSGRPS